MQIYIRHDTLVVSTLLLKTMYMTLEEAISDVITNNFSAGDLFDSHAVINELIKDKEKHLVYMQSFGNRGSLENYHSIISKK